MNNVVDGGDIKATCSNVRSEQDRICSVFEPEVA